MDKPIPEDVRHQFETWARPKWRHREDFDQRIGAPRGTYNNIEVQAAWEAWQALTAAQQQGQAVAWVPVHPKQGPLWSMATDKPDRERLPSYPLRPLIYGDEPQPTQQGGGEVAGWVLGDAFVDAKFWTADTPPQGWTPVYRTAPPSAPVGVDAPLSVFSAGAWTYETGQVFSADDLDGAAFAVYRPHLAQQPAACDMGELCIGCEPRNPDGSCPDKQPGAVDEKYAELIYAVARKYPGESRHETALRYIRQAESADHGPAQVAAQHQEPKS